MVEKMEKNERKLRKQLRIYMKKVQELEGRGRCTESLWPVICPLVKGGQVSTWDMFSLMSQSQHVSPVMSVSP